MPSTIVAIIMDDVTFDKLSDDSTFNVLLDDATFNELSGVTFDGLSDDFEREILRQRHMPIIIAAAEKHKTIARINRGIMAFRRIIRCMRCHQVFLWVRCLNRRAASFSAFWFPEPASQGCE